MRVLLLSTYELGGQPLGCAGPAAALAAAGHDTRVRDLSVTPLADDDLVWAEAVALSVPMHTALRLAAGVLDAIRTARPGLRVALHGLYAPVGLEAGLLGPGDLAAAGASDAALLDWLDAAPPAIPLRPAALRVELGPARRGAPAPLPDRSGLPPLDAYARFVADGELPRLVGTIDATAGCSHRCRHCPVPLVYDGRTRANDVAAVLADAAQLAVSGATHFHFGDPDFLNRPRHALEVARALHDAHPHASFDATVKVSHVIDHAPLFEELASLGCRFIVTAVESLSPVVLERLDKGHVAEDAARAVVVLRDAGIEPRPSLLPFTPWTTRADLVELLDFAAALDLIWNIDPVQWGIRLLLPPSSLLLEAPDPTLAAALGAFDPDALGTTWRSADPLLDELALEVAAVAERAEADGRDPAEGYAAVRAAVFEGLGLADTGPAPHPLSLRARSRLEGPARPRLTESWFCCAEPTAAQRSLAAGPSGPGARR